METHDKTESAQIPIDGGRFHPADLGSLADFFIEQFLPIPAVPVPVTAVLWGGMYARSALLCGRTTIFFFREMLGFFSFSFTKHSYFEHTFDIYKRYSNNRKR